MPIPFIFGAVAAGAAIVGAVQAISGVDKLNKAQQIGELAQQRYESAISELEADREATNKVVQEYVKLQLDINRLTIGRFVRLVQKIGQRANNNKAKILVELKISPKQLQNYQKAALKAEEFLSSGTTMINAGVIASQGVVGFAGLIGTASTGTTISTLSGAAATNATLAWLGGGSLASGGGGMALGSLVLGGVTLGSAFMVGGFMIAGKGEEALIKAQKYELEVNTAIIQIKSARDFLQKLRQRLIDLSNVVHKLDSRIAKILEKLESQTFDKDKNKNSLKWLEILIKTLEKIQKTPVLDGRGNLNSDTEVLLHPGLVNFVEKEQNKIEFLQQTGTVLVVLLLLGFSGWNIFNRLRQEHNTIQPHPEQVKYKR